MLTVTAHFRDVGLIGDNEKQAMETGKKVVYIAPMKALAQEVVDKFSSKLKPLGLIVRELTGDMQLTRAEAQSANVIVTTPEKWDVVTRKSGNDDNSLGNQCGLLIIDEVHLLADERGAVIESVVSRLHRLVESRQRQQRIVGLSATLPNYEDVAEFLQVPERGLFYFGPEHRPVPLQQTFIGVTGRIKDRHLIERKMNDVCYETVSDALERGYQVMVFVHSRKATGDTATAMAERAAAKGDLDRLFVTQGNDGADGDAQQRYMDRVKKSRNRELANHFYNGMGIHHAGTSIAASSARRSMQYIQRLHQLGAHMLIVQQCKTHINRNASWRPQAFRVYVRGWGNKSFILYSNAGLGSKFACTHGRGERDRRLQPGKGQDG